jgi:peptidoglycan DL-endopeptidase CwlO
MATPSAALRASARRPLLTAGLALAAALGVLLPGAPAHAAPGDPTTIGEAAELVAARGHELEVLSEEFNEARENLAAQQAAAAAAVAEVEQAQAALATAQQQVRGIARSAFTGEGIGSLRAMLTSESADEFVNRMATLETIAGHQNGILQAAATASTAAAQARATAEETAADAQARFDAVAGQQAALEAQIAEYQAVFDRLTAEEQRAAVTASGHEDRASRDSRAEPAPSGPVVASSAAAQVAVDAAMAQRGKPYVWAASGPGSFDCSGLTQFAYRAAGISLPHSSRMQSQMGQAVSRDQLQPGDLVFFYSPVSHVGIYIGNGQMVHAPTSGDVVKVAPLMGGYAGARRIAG